MRLFVKVIGDGQGYEIFGVMGNDGSLLLGRKGQLLFIATAAAISFVGMTNVKSLFP